MALNEAIPRHKGCRDSFVRNLVKGTIRQTVTLDYITGMLASNGLKGIKTRTLIIIRMGLYAIREMDSVPDHAAVNEAVALARKTARGTDRFINAVLRSYLRRRTEFEVSGLQAEVTGDKERGLQAEGHGKAAETSGSENAEMNAACGNEGSIPRFIAEISDPVKRLSVQYAMPEDLVSLIASQYGDEAESILRGLNEPPAVVLRVNALKTTREQLIADLADEGITAEPADECSAAVTAAGRGIIESDLYRRGHFTVQSLSSMLAVSALAPEPGSRVLDMCAAPGGKSTMMAEMMGNEGSVTACDIHEHRLELIKASAARTGAGIIETRLMDGTQYDSSLEGQFDFVLADVPCSGLGVMSTKPEIRLRTDVSSYDELTETQFEILENAFRYTRPGGRLCYSTCTINREENEGVTGRFMERFAHDKKSGFARIVEMRTILPYNNLIGFHYCIIEKNL